LYHRFILALTWASGYLLKKHVSDKIIPFIEDMLTGGIIAYDESVSKVYLYNPATNTWPNSYPDFPDAIKGDLVSTGDKLFGFATCTSNNKMIGYALSETDPVSINKVLNTVNQKLYLYKKN